MFDGFRQGRHETGMANIAHVTGGDGPPVLLLHGFPQTKAMWAKIAPQLAQTHTVVAADLRGYGDSSKPVNGPDCGNYCFRAMADDMVSLMLSLGHETFHLVGHDRGGRTAHERRHSREKLGASDHQADLLALVVLVARVPMVALAAQRCVWWRVVACRRSRRRQVERRCKRRRRRRRR